MSTAEDSQLADLETEHVDVLIIGAGLSGIGAAHHIQHECPWASYAILEARGAIGGTWDLFRYPGIRSDSDMHTLGYPFRPWTGEKSIADGDSIREYIEDTAAEAGIDRHIRFGMRVLRAQWSTADARWRITAERVDPEGDAPAEPVELTCSFLFSCSGYYRYDHGYLPDFEAMDDFTGTIVHPQAWPQDLDYNDKQVVVIGSGATAVTLVPAMAADAAHVTMLQRSPTYMASVPTRNPLAQLVRSALPPRMSGPVLKWINALMTQGLFQLSRRRPELVKRLLRRGVQSQLPEDFDIDTHFSPDYDPWDQRLCAVADGDLFKALRDGSVSIVTDHIERFTPTGLRLTSGAELDADVIVTATGLELLFLGGIEISVDGEEVDATDRLTYKGMMLEGVPNLAMAIGYTNASWTLKSDLTCEYVCRLLNHMRSTRIQQCTPVSQDASVSSEPLLGLSAGYIQRAADKFPRQGSKFPWRVHQSYLRDFRALRMSNVVDDAMTFSNPIDPGSPTETNSSSRGSNMTDLNGRVAAITGAASGIGRALAVELSRRGCHLALADIDEAGLSETVSRCEGAGVKVTSQVLDVADREAVIAWAASVAESHGMVNLVFNNAGVALGATVESMSYEDFEWLMNINFWGVVHGTKAFLPYLEASGNGHIVNISSVFGLISVPTQSAYNSAKFAVRGFTDALRMELESADNGVSCTTVHPGGIRTNIARNARIDPSVLPDGSDRTDHSAEFDKIARTTPEKAAQKILDAVKQDRRRVTIGPDGVLIDLLSRLPAGLYQRILVRAAARRTS